MCILPALGLGLEDDADLVRKDLLALAHLVEGGRVDHLVQLREEKQVREDRELLHELLGLLNCRLPTSKPLGVGIGLDDVVVRHNLQGFGRERRAGSRRGDHGALRAHHDREKQERTHVDGWTISARPNGMVRGSSKGGTYGPRVGTDESAA